MENLSITQIVEKLIGPINPIGKSEIDEERLKNFKEMCELVNNLVIKIDTVVGNNKNAYEHSIKEFVNYGDNFLSKILGK